MKLEGFRSAINNVTSLIIINVDLHRGMFHFIVVIYLSSVVA